MSEKLFRTLMLLKHLPMGSGAISAQQIAERLRDDGFEITERSVQRDLMRLHKQASFLPIHCNPRSKPYSWSWSKEFKGLDIPQMTPEAAVALKLLIQFAKPLLPTAVLAHLRQQAAQADAALARFSGGALQRWPKKVRTLPAGMALIAPPVEAITVERVYEALLRDRQIEADYRRADGKAKRHAINVLGLIARGEFIYLIANYEAQALMSPMILALYRLSKVVVTEKRTVNPPGFDIDEYIATGIPDIRESGEIDLEFEVDKSAGAHFLDYKLSPDQQVSETERGTLRVRARTVDTLALRRWLLGYGEKLVVVGPKALRDDLKAQVKAMAKRYESQGARKS